MFIFHLVLQIWINKITTKNKEGPPPPSKPRGSDSLSSTKKKKKCHPQRTSLFSVVSFGLSGYTYIMFSRPSFIFQDLFTAAAHTHKRLHHWRLVVLCFDSLYRTWER